MTEDGEWEKNIQQKRQTRAADMINCGDESEGVVVEMLLTKEMKSSEVTSRFISLLSRPVLLRLLFSFSKKKLDSELLSPPRREFPLKM